MTFLAFSGYYGRTAAYVTLFHAPQHKSPIRRLRQGQKIVQEIGMAGAKKLINLYCFTTWEDKRPKEFVTGPLAGRRTGYKKR